MHTQTTNKMLVVLNSESASVKSTQLGPNSACMRADLIQTCTRYDLVHLVHSNPIWVLSPFTTP